MDQNDLQKPKFPYKNDLALCLHARVAFRGDEVRVGDRNSGAQTQCQSVFFVCGNFDFCQSIWSIFGLGLFHFTPFMQLWRANIVLNRFCAPNTAALEQTRSAA